MNCIWSCTVYRAFFFVPAVRPKKFTWQVPSNFMSTAAFADTLEQQWPGLNLSSITIKRELSG